jgi:hypothetical protein
MEAHPGGALADAQASGWPGGVRTVASAAPHTCSPVDPVSMPLRSFPIWTPLWRKLCAFTHPPPPPAASWTRRVSHAPRGTGVDGVGRQRTCCCLFSCPRHACAPAGGITLPSGLHAPEGTLIFVSVYAMHRDPDYWWVAELRQGWGGPQIEGPCRWGGSGCQLSSKALSLAAAVAATTWRLQSWTVGACPTLRAQLPSRPPPSWAASAAAGRGRRSSCRSAGCW